MKKLLILLFFPLLIYSQEISYDYFIEKTFTFENGQRKEPKINKLYYFVNSKTGDELILTKYGQKFIASIFDSKTSLIHYYYILEKKDGFDAVYSNSYLHESNNSKINSYISNSQNNNIKVIKNEDSFYSILIYSKKRKKKPKITINAKIEKSVAPNFYISLDDRVLSNEISEKLKYEFANESCCYAVTKYEKRYGKYITTMNLNRIIEFNLILKVPEKLKIDSI